MPIAACLHRSARPPCRLAVGCYSSPQHPAPSPLPGCPGALHPLPCPCPLPCCSAQTLSIARSSPTSASARHAAPPAVAVAPPCRRPPASSAAAFASGLPSPSDGHPPCIPRRQCRSARPATSSVPPTAACPAPRRALPRTLTSAPARSPPACLDGCWMSPTLPTQSAISARFQVGWWPWRECPAAAEHHGGPREPAACNCRCCSSTPPTCPLHPALSLQAAPPSAPPAPAPPATSPWVSCPRLTLGLAVVSPHAC